ncbi:prolyl oligopeptidase family serine peptidase, partial [candidate division KSB1 bacterium]
SYSWQSEEDSSACVWVVNSDGSNNRKLLENFRDFYTWLPETHSILYSKRQDFYLLDAKTGKSERLTEDKSGISGRSRGRFGRTECLVSEDGKFIVFTNRKGIWKLEIPDKEQVQLAANTGRGLRFSPDENKISYTMDNNLYILDIESRNNEKVTDLEKVKDNTKDPNLSSHYWSPDGKYIVYTASKSNTKRRSAIVPQFMGKYVTGRPARNSFAGDKNSDTYIYVIDLKSKDIKEVDTGEFKRFSVYGVYWAENSKFFLINKYTEYQRERYILKVNPKSCAVSILFNEKDETWLSSMASNLILLKDDKEFLFTSEKSGYNHIFWLSTKGGKPEQITSGNWQIESYAINSEKDKVIYVSTEIATEERHIYLLDLKTGKRRKLKTEEGMNTDFSLSKDGEKILYSHMDVDFPEDYYLINLKKDSEPVRITNSIPEKFKEIKWVRPEFIEYPNIDDGVMVKARLYLPENMDRNKKYPLVVFIHGAGSLQNVVKGWDPYTPNIKWHTRLVEKGYIVLDPDYRHSTGYGRDFRTGIYGFMGGKDTRDVVSGIEYLKKQGFIDETKVGTYGGSYGGFLTIMCLCLEPEYFTCGAALRSVTDWKNYNAGYTNARLGTPQDNPEAYKKSSPITYAEKLTRPLLLIHGLVDSNVFSQDSFQFAEKLIEAGIHFDFMIYPSQNHGFTDPESWTDEYRRIEEFFDKYLMK